MLSENEVRLLAGIYADAQRRSLKTVSQRACGNHAALPNLARGKHVRSDTLERLGKFFQREWPSDLEWPLSAGRVNGESVDR
jgi:hypothetical protein